MVSHQVPIGGVEPLGTKVSSASTPHAGRKSLVTCCCRALTTGRISVSVSSVLALMIEIWMAVVCGICFSFLDEILEDACGEQRGSVFSSLCPTCDLRTREIALRRLPFPIMGKRVSGVGGSWTLLDFRGLLVCAVTLLGS